MSPYSTILRAHSLKLLNTELFSDLTVVCQENIHSIAKEFQVHKSFFSMVFPTPNLIQVERIKFQGVPIACMTSFLKFLYTGEPDAVWIHYFKPILEALNSWETMSPCLQFHATSFASVSMKPSISLELTTKSKSTSVGKLKIKEETLDEYGDEGHLEVKPRPAELYNNYENDFERQLKDFDATKIEDDSDFDDFDGYDGDFVDNILEENDEFEDGGRMKKKRLKGKLKRPKSETNLEKTCSAGPPGEPVVRTEFHVINGETIPSKQVGIQCVLCDKVLHTKGTLVRHAKIHHKEGFEKARLAFEALPSTPFSAPQGHHAIRKLQPSKLNVERGYKCPVCHIAYYARAQVEGHFKRDHPNMDIGMLEFLKSLKPYKCDKCDFASRVPDLLEDHLNDFHESRTFPCHNCDKVFDTARRLKQHVKMVHIERELKVGHYCY